MSNAKRAIMVPVMTLAVCAIAMVGLGFAITTSVTSNSNTAEKLMVDLDDNYSQLSTQEKPDETDVNKILSYHITTDKSSDTSDKTTTIVYSLEGGWTYAKIFGNLTDYTLSAKIDGSSLPMKIKSVKLGIYNTSGSGPTGDCLATVTLNSTAEGYFTGTDTTNSPNTTTVMNKYGVTTSLFVISIEEIVFTGITTTSTDITINSTGATIIYTNNGGSSDTYKYGDTSVGSFADFTNVGPAAFTFTVTA